MNIIDTILKLEIFSCITLDMSWIMKRFFIAILILFYNFHLLSQLYKNMKGILASTCALAFVGISIATFPNDLFFHHHPDLVLDTNKNQIVNKYSQPQGKKMNLGMLSQLIDAYFLYR